MSPADARLLKLKERVEREPTNTRALHDYITALGEAGRDGEILPLVPRLDVRTAPVNVLVRVGRAASDLKQFDVAVQMYRAALARAPSRLDVLAGLSYALVDTGQPQEAVAILEARQSLTWSSVPLLEAYAEALRAQRDETQALIVYERILLLAPNNREAQRNRIFTLARLGAPHRAVDLAGERPGLLSDAELLSLQSDRAAVATRWGAATDADLPERFLNTDRALAENEQLLNALRTAGQTGSAAERRLLFDRIEALRNRVRMKDAVDLYERLVNEGIEVPPHARIAAADAYLYLEEPETARDLYLNALPHVEDNFAGQVQLFYAYSDAGQYQEALQQIDRLAAATPPRIAEYSPLTVSDNPDHASAMATAGAARAYQDQLADAQRRLESMRGLAPYNMEAREKLAGVYGARGWLERAEQEHLWILTAEPKHREARIGYADNLRDLEDWRAAESEAAALEQQFPEDKQVQRIARRWRNHERPELRVEAGAGSSSGGASPFGSRERAIESWLYSSPIKYDWRAFLHHYDASATFPEGDASRRRVGAGAEYRRRDVTLAGEVTSTYGGESRAGVALAGLWRLNDLWLLEAAADSSSNDIPLEARLTGVRGTSLAAGATYRISELRRFAAGAQTLDFSDGNRRNILNASAFQRLVTGPIYKLDAAVSVSTSTNSRDDAPYFNPGRDVELSGTLIGEQRLWRRYDRDFVHRLYGTLGQYRQSGFGSGLMMTLRYEHAWALDERLDLIYGARYSRHPYDGEDEHASYYDLALSWRF